MEGVWAKRETEDLGKEVDWRIVMGEMGWVGGLLLI